MLCIAVVVVAGKYVNRGITELSVAANASQRLRLEEAHPSPLVYMALVMRRGQGSGVQRLKSGRRCVEEERAAWVRWFSG